MNPKHEHITNEQLVEQFQNGREDAVKLLIKRFHPKLVRTISYYTRNAEPVDDLVQDCWYAIIEKLEKLQLKISFEAWALTIARRKAIDWIRNQQRQREHSTAIEAEANIEIRESANDETELEKIQVAIKLLKPAHRIVLKMFYLENLSLTEISKILDISKGTVKSRLFHAREKLKNIINP